VSEQQGNRQIGIRVIVCGGRNYRDRETAFATLDRISSEMGGIIEVSHGGAAGADQLANEWCKERGVACRVFPADRKQYGKAAGPRRNQTMLDHCLLVHGLDLVIAFPGGKGTNDMLRRASALHVSVWQVA
jgi:hypothetical protein